MLVTCIVTGEPAVARLNGTYFQLLEDHGSWSPAHWNQLFKWLDSVGVHYVILQWSVFGNLAFYPSATFNNVPNTPLETILTTADSFHMSVLVGLVHDADYWSNIQRDPASVASYLRKLRARSSMAARELAPLLEHHRCVEGWYISGEIDDINWRTREARELLFDHVASLARDLRRLMPQRTLAISTFSQAQSSPPAFQQFWDEFFQRTSLDMVLFQDGVGANKLDISEVPIYLNALRDAAQKNNRRVRVVVELFRQVGGPPIDNLVFRAVPASLDRIRLQLKVAGKYSPGEIIGFSIAEYMTPLGGDSAKDLFSQYQRLLNEKSSVSSTGQNNSRRPN
jgi:hypothetical protein